jgi:hypothetical protein
MQFSDSTAMRVRSSVSYLTVLYTATNGTITTELLYKPQKKPRAKKTQGYKKGSQ